MKDRNNPEGSGESRLEELRQIAYRDFLTGIPNRRFFMEDLTSRIQRMSGSGDFLLLGIIDLNGFKAINDLYGHKIGDRILVEVASRLSGLMGVSDLMARLGGDEFAFIFSHFKRIREVRDKVEEILAELARPISLEGMEETLMVSGSIGATLYPDDDSDPRTLLHHADLALYEVKKRKQSAWSFYLAEFYPPWTDPDRPDKVREVIGIDQAEFLFRPQFHLSDASVCGAEIVVRRKPHGGSRKQGAFGNTSAPPLLRGGEGLLLRHAMEELRRWKSLEKELYLHVGFGNHNTGLQRSADDLIPVLMEFQDVVHRLVLEVSQPVAHHSFDQARGLFSKIRRFGALTAIGDFGRGGLFLPSLMNLEPDRIVLCPSLVSGMTRDPRSLGIVANAFLAGGTVGSEVIASGITVGADLRILRKLGCSTGTGNFYGAPVPEKEFQSLLRRGEGQSRVLESGHPVSVEQILLLFVCEEPLAWIESHRGLFYSDNLPYSEETLLLAGNRAQCGLGRWLSGPGWKSFGKYDEFMEIERLHHRFHDTADPLLITFKTSRQGGKLNDREREEIRLMLEEIARELCLVAQRLEGRTIGAG